MPGDRMHTIPTLCATSTVGVAAVGFSLACPLGAQQSPPSSGKRKALHDLDWTAAEQQNGRRSISSPLPSVEKQRARLQRRSGQPTSRPHSRATSLLDHRLSWGRPGTVPSETGTSVLTGTDDSTGTDAIRHYESAGRVRRKTSADSSILLTRPRSEHALDTPKSSHISRDRPGTAFAATPVANPADEILVSARANGASDPTACYSSPLPASTWSRLSSKRLSSSLEQTPPSTPGPHSPSFTFSHGSAAPILRSSTDSPNFSPLPPNKLVKRATSLRLPSRKTSMPLVGRAARVPILRRPATSHQRSATIHEAPTSVVHDLAGTSPSVSNNPSPAFATPVRTGQSSPGQQVPWRFYFTPSKIANRSKESPATRPGTAGPRREDTRLGPRRIWPSVSAQPILVKSTSISEENGIDSEADALAALSLDDQSELNVLGSSRPGTPAAILESSSVEPTPEQLVSREKSEQPSTPRRSFTISEMVGNSRPSWLPRAPSLRNKGRASESPNDSNAKVSSHLPPANNKRLVPPFGGRRTKTTRRNITDPTIFQDSKAQHRERKSQREELAAALPPLRRLSSFNPDLPYTLSSPLSSQPTTPGQDQDSTPFRRPSPNASSFAEQHRSKRVSLASPSDRTSTLVGSDTDFGMSPMGPDDDEIDFQSDTVFDSVRTRATSSSSGHVGPRIETMFDDGGMFPDKLSKVQEFPIRTTTPNSLSLKRAELDRYTVIPEETESLTTLGKRHRQASDGGVKDSVPTGPTPPQQKDLVMHDSNSSESGLGIAQISSRDTTFSLMDEDDDDWTRDVDEGLAHKLSSPQSQSMRALQGISLSRGDSEKSLGGEREQRDTIIGGEADKNTVRNLFQWTEPASHEATGVEESDNRPRTVHGKQLSENWGRTDGRRRPSGLHVRRQSVSVVADPKSQADSDAATSRFATWGFGSKGPSEDWNEDFDFGAEEESTSNGLETKQDYDNDAFLMRVPQSIRERQASVIGHLCHVREFALLVEDLKRLRLLANSKGITHGSSKPLWKEADGIIALATVENDEDCISSSASPKASSPGSDAPATAPRTATPAVTSQSNVPPEIKASRSPSSSAFGSEISLDDDGPTVMKPPRARRKSILGIDDDIFGPPDGLPVRSGSQSAQLATPMKVQVSREEHHTEPSAVAKYVVDTLHQKRKTPNPTLTSETANGTEHRTQFDTTSLRDLVAHVSVLSRKLAELVRQAEESSNSSRSSPQLSPAPSLNQILASSVPPSSPPSMGSGRIGRRQSNSTITSAGLSTKDSEITTGHLPMMTVV